MNKTAVLYALRHGETTLNAQNKFRGEANPPLDENGKQAAREAVSWFGDKPIGYILSSDKLRTRQTIKPYLEMWNRDDVIFTEQFRALDVGDFSGKEKNEANLQAIQYYIDRPELDIPGGESINHFRSRVQPLLATGVNLAQKAGAPTLLVAHSSIIREIGNFIHNDRHSARVEPGGIAAVFYENGRLRAEAVSKPHLSVDRDPNIHFIS